MIVQRRQNGFGLRYGLRFDEASVAYEPWFDNYEDYADDAFKEGAVVLAGEPGAGKSHITEDVLLGTYNLGRPVCMVSCHINSGNRIGRQATQETFQAAADMASDCLVIIDNLDYLVYTGAVRRRRTNASVTEYAAFMTSEVARLQEMGCAILATIHTQEWRENHSQAPSAIWAAYGETVASLGGEVTFTGVITEENAARLLRLRGIDTLTAADIARELKEADALYFRQAHHISPQTYQEGGIQAAITEVDEFKKRKITGGA